MEMIEHVLLTAKLKLYGFLCKKKPEKLTEPEVQMLYCLANDEGVQKFLEMGKYNGNKD